MIFLSLTQSVAQTTNEWDRSNIYGCTVYNSFIPVWALYKNTDSEHFLDKDGKHQILWHHKYPKRRFTPIGSKYANLFSYFKIYNNPGYWMNSANAYYVRKGMITTTDFQVLICVCINSNEWQTIDKENPDLEKFVIIVNKSLINHHKLLYNRVKKEILSNTTVDIIETNNPNKYCFKTPNFIPQFKNLIEMQSYLNSINDLLCLKRKEEVLV